MPDCRGIGGLEGFGGMERLWKSIGKVRGARGGRGRERQAIRAHASRLRAAPIPSAPAVQEHCTCQSTPRIQVQNVSRPVAFYDPIRACPGAEKVPKSPENGSFWDVKRVKFARVKRLFFQK